jgi:CRISPR/Cas system-associated exonuclease Cas4 (RecB family)
MRNIEDPVIREVEKVVQSKFAAAAIAYLNDEERTGVHITNLVYDCLRKGYWEYLQEQTKQPQNLAEDQIITFTVGRKLHELVMSDKHEFPFAFQEIHGRADEIITDSKNGRVIIADKKSCTKLPDKKWGPQEHHVKQIEYYAVLCSFLNDFANYPNYYGCIIYISVGEDKGTRAFGFKIDLERARSEFMEKLATMRKAIESKTPPSSYYDWVCSYCSYYQACRKLDAGATDWEKFLHV